MRGFLFADLPAQSETRQIIFESNLERRVLLTFLARPDLVDIWDQPPEITYTTAKGTARRHIPDFLATLQSGRRLAVAVKPAVKVERLGFRAELSRVRSAMPPAYADEVLLVTDADLTDSEVRNAELLYIARERVDAQAKAAMLRFLANLREPTTFGDILAAFELPGRGWAALICALHEEAAKVDWGRKIGKHSVIYPRGDA